MGGGSRTLSRSVSSSSSVVLLGPFPSPVPTSSTQLETSSPHSSGQSSYRGPSPTRVSRLTLSDLWEPRSTSTPVPSGTIEDVNHVDSVPVSTQMLKNILKTVAGCSASDESKDEVFTKDELVILVSRFKDLGDDEKNELFEYVKLLEIRNPQLVRSVREEVNL